ncbi:hypothetical protein IFM89_008042 [Coptis chinensis]|uniref:Uncharacterized protein n=1 Tax=Coptis chinensis TaxID=261450 RepID=A0A835LQQ8_9MAGN|nr:hypothetical protein IFM89_008042 [Coptis chinensis]
MKGELVHELEMNIPASDVWEIYGTLKLARLMGEVFPHIFEKIEVIVSEFMNAWRKIKRKIDIDHLIPLELVQERWRRTTVCLTTLYPKLIQSVIGIQIFNLQWQ